jgi:anti-sigma factor RsiW
MIELSDELLVAYVDGELNAPQRAAVQAQLKSDEAAREKVRDLEDTSRLLRMAFEDEPVATVVQLKPRPGRPSLLARRPVLSGLAAAAAVVLMIATGAIGWHTETSDDRAEFMEEVAAYHAIYAAETEHLAEVPAGRKAHIEEWLGRRLNRSLSVPDLVATGWDFEGARLLAEGHNPIASCFIPHRDGSRSRSASPSPTRAKPSPSSTIRATGCGSRPGTLPGTCILSSERWIPPN